MHNNYVTSLLFLLVSVYACGLHAFAHEQSYEAAEHIFLCEDLTALKDMGRLVNAQLEAINTFQGKWCGQDSDPRERYLLQSIDGLRNLYTNKIENTDSFYEARVALKALLDSMFYAHSMMCEKLLLAENNGAKLSLVQFYSEAQGLLNASDPLYAKVHALKPASASRSMVGQPPIVHSKFPQQDQQVQCVLGISRFKLGVLTSAVVLIVGSVGYSIKMRHDKQQGDAQCVSGV